MGKYSGVLICSDFDGTIYCSGKISENNILAIKYFCANGGRFTLATGRYPSSAQEMAAGITFTTPIIAMNGALIYDPVERKICDEHFIPEKFMGTLAGMIRDNDGMDSYCLYYRDGSCDVKPGAGNDLRIPDGRTPLYKVIFYSVPGADAANNLKERLCTAAGDGLSVTRSWVRGIEVQSREATKGNAALWLKRRLGAELLVCVGDYENDISMIRAADIGYAVGNGSEELKKEADRVTVAASEDVLAHIIDEL